MSSCCIRNLCIDLRAGVGAKLKLWSTETDSLAVEKSSFQVHHAAGCGQNNVLVLGMHFLRPWWAVGFTFALACLSGLYEGKLSSASLCKCFAQLN